jgi:hypothetical protein
MSETPPNTEQIKRAWLRIPEEEKRELITAAKAKGFEACLLLAVFGVSAAFGLKMPAILLGTAVLLPLLYQVISVREWREKRPHLIAKYMVAGHTASQYASSMLSKDPAVKVLFRGSLTPPLKVRAQLYPELEPEELEAQPIPVWVSLFPDHLIMISEGEKGAKLEFAHSTLDNFRLVSDDAEESEEPRDTMAIETEDPDGEAARWVIQSPHATAILACEKKIRLFHERALAEQEGNPHMSMS